MRSVSSIGERALIRRIEKRYTSKTPASIENFTVRVPLGDDAFVAKLSTGASLVWTTDTMIEGTHFNINWMNHVKLKGWDGWSCLGYKAMASNLSDLASMGNVRPLFALVTIGIDGDISVDTVDKIYRGITGLTSKYRFSIVGGDIIRSDKSIISIAIVGNLIANNPLTRSGASIGDALMASGPLGLSSAGFEVLKRNRGRHPPLWKELARSHLCPEPKMAEGRVLSDRATMATSMIDTSDDLMTSLEILGEKSGVGFELDLDQVPIHPALTEFSTRWRASPYSFFLYGGEDYQLLFTVPMSKVPLVKKKIPEAYAMGRVRPKSFGIRVKMNGRPFHLRDVRFRHF